MKPILGIMLGEAAGIGPEVIARLTAEGKLQHYCRPVLIGDARVLRLGQKIAGVKFPFTRIKDISQMNWDGPIPLLDLENFDPEALTMGEINIESGKVTGDTIVESLKLLKAEKIDGFVFGPLNKQAFKLGGYHYEDEHKLFAECLDWVGKLHGIMNVMGDLWTFRVTGHIPLSEVATSINQENVYNAIKLADITLKKAGYKRPVIGLAALNPHAGEGGLCGREEIERIMPAIKKAQAEDIEAVGPFSADTIFIDAFNGKFDAVVTMYHDQGQIATKLKAFDVGVTVSAGLPYPVTTPEHGTAFNIAGKGIAKTTATEEAVRIAAQMAGWRG